MVVEGAAREPLRRPPQEVGRMSDAVSPAPFHVFPKSAILNSV